MSASLPTSSLTWDRLSFGFDICNYPMRIPIASDPNIFAGKKENQPETSLPNPLTERNLFPKLEWSPFLLKFQKLSENNVEEALALANLQLTKSTGKEKVQLYELMATFTNNNKLYDQARHYLNMLCIHDSENMNHWKNHFRLEFILGNFDKALEIIEKGLDKFPNSPILMEFKVQCLGNLGKLDQLRGLIQTIPVTETESYTKVLLIAASEEAKSGNLRESRAIYQQVIDNLTHPCPQAWIDYMMQEMNWLNFDRAISIGHQALNAKFINYSNLWEYVIQIEGVREFCYVAATGEIQRISVKLDGDKYVIYLPKEFAERKFYGLEGLIQDPLFSKLLAIPSKP